MKEVDFGLDATGGVVNICMITFNRLEYTRQSLEALTRQSAGYPFVLTVVDNGSTDGSVDFLREQRDAGVIKNLILLPHNIGVARAANIGWQLEPDAEYYMKLDNDMVAQKTGWLAAIVNTVEAISEIGLIGYNVEPGSYPLSEVNGCRVRIKQGTLGGACVLIPRRTHDKLGFWCEEYGLYGEEDADYGRRSLIAGLLNVYMEDETVFFHLPAGRAAVIDLLTRKASDGIEEVYEREYRAWKDAQRRVNSGSGSLFHRNVHAYANGTRSLYCAVTSMVIAGVDLIEDVRRDPQLIDVIYKVNTYLVRGNIDLAVKIVARELPLSHRDKVIAAIRMEKNESL